MSMIFRSSIFSLILFMGLGALAALNPSTWSLRYLARASNALLVASDQSLEKKSVMCGIKGAQISALSQGLHALVDAKIAALSTNQKATIRQQASSCADECTCDIYKYHFEKSLDAADTDALKRMSSQFESVTAEKRQACAAKFSEFCSSQLLKALQ